MAHSQSVPKGDREEGKPWRYCQICKSATVQWLEVQVRDMDGKVILSFLCCEKCLSRGRSILGI